MQIGCALSVRTRVADAVDEAATRLTARLGAAPDVVFVFASPRLRGDLASIPTRVSARLSSPLVCGCSGDGVLADGHERERVPALAMMGFVLPSDARARPLRAEAGARSLAIRRGATGVVLLADPISADVDAILRGFDAQNRGATMVGGLASGSVVKNGRPRHHTLFLEGWAFRDGVVGVELGGSVRLDSLVSQGCRPIGEPMIVTRWDGSRILELDRGRPLEVIRELHRCASEEDRRLIREALLCGIEMRSSQLEYRAGDFLVRPILGVEAERGAVLVGASLDGYPVVQFHVRDRRASATDLHDQLRRYGGSDVRGALLFSCVERGAELYGEPDHDSRALAEHLGPTPVAGFFGNGEIGPVQGRTYVHGNTSALGLIRWTPKAARAATSRKSA
jgi:small ligand-binding sensory domain FIST